MAEKVIIPLEAKVDKAIEEIASLKDELKGVAKSNKAVAKSTKGLAKGFRGLGLAMKTAGIGLVIEAFNFLKNIVGQNQVVIDALSTTTQALGMIFRQIGNEVVEVGQKIFNAFKQPQKTLASISNKLEEFRTYIADKFSGVGTILTGIFTFNTALIKTGLTEIKGDFQNFKEDVSSVYDDVTTKVKETTKSFISNAKASIDTASALTEQRKEVTLLEAGQQKLMLSYQNQAELQRQIRDDESLTFQERIAANKQLGAILDEQLATEQSLAQKKVDLATAELSLNKDNLDLQVALIQAETELVDIEERITGQRSEQLTNQNSLLREQSERVSENIQIIGGLSKALSSLAGDNKELAAASAIIDTYAGASKALAQGGIFGIISAGTIIAAGLNNVKQIYKTKIPNGGGGAASGGGGSVPSVGSNIAASLPTQTNLSDVVSSVNQSNQEPIRAYVIGQDVTDSQEAQSYLNNQKTL
jgi:hypothetical protein